MATIKISLQLLVIIPLSFFLFSCKKDMKQEITSNISPTPPPNPTPVGNSQVNDVAFQKTQDYYLWNNQLPATFITSGYADPIGVMTAIRQFSIEPGYTTPVDRWSFAMKKTEWNLYSGGMSSVSSSTSAAGDFGITVFFRAEGDLRVRLSEPNSPGGILGIKRGWRITKINGNTNITTSNAQYIIDNIYKAVSADVSFTKPDGTSVDINLQAAHYADKPVYLDTVYNSLNGNIGYLVYNSFLGNITQTTTEYARVFDKFAAAGITNLIVDLRYNGGGYVNLQQQLANYLITSQAQGSVMMKQSYNSNHSNENTTVLFNKSGSLQLTKIYFIVSRSTASASELLINNLKPYMDVRLLGNSNTHGKPVGFFPIEDGEWYVFPVSFKTVNKNGEGNYYGGFTPNAIVADGLDKDWGDVNENSLASALRNISSGSFRNGGTENYSENAAVKSGNDALEKNMLKLTIGSK
jgi:C-terminal processing protease CtpA/Prc